jgi:hypothetical protein
MSRLIIRPENCRMASEIKAEGNTGSGEANGTTDIRNGA